MKIEITAGGIYGADGEIAIGTVLDVKDEPKGWTGRYRVISGGDAKGKEAVTNPAKAKGKEAVTSLRAEHHGGGKFNIMEGEAVHLTGLSKADADAFNGMSDEDKRAYVAEAGKKDE